MQIWAESGKSALPICNYSQILYQFLTFTQNLKRSHKEYLDAYRISLVMELYNNKFVSCYRNTKFHICTYHSSNGYNDTVVLHCYWENTPKWRLIAYNLSLYTISTE